MTASPTPELLPSLSTASRQALFQLPQVAFAYERGWRSNFKRAGFPGPTVEADLALDFLFPTPPEDTEILLDMSCGTGILSRHLALQSNFVLNIIAADISHAMLSEASSRIKKDVTLSSTEIVQFIRADVSSLPFCDGALQSVHAGAALHCWPELQDSLKEIRRVMKPGGRFFATTFFKSAYWPRGGGVVGRVAKVAIPVVDRLQTYIPITRAYRFFNRDELEYLLKAAGFASVEVEERGGCAIVRCIEGDK